MSDLTDDAGRGWPTMPYSTRSPKDDAVYRRLADLRAQTGDALTAAEALIAETDWTPPPRQLLCGCWTDGRMCAWHAPVQRIAAEWPR